MLCFWKNLIVSNLPLIVSLSRGKYQKKKALLFLCVQIKSSDTYSMAGIKKLA